MAVKNPDWAVEQLDEFIRLTAGRYRGQPDEEFGVWFETQGAADPSDITEQWAVVEMIFEAELPGMTIDTSNESAYESPWRLHREQAVRLRARIARRREIEENIGDGAPQLSASQLHPWVWDAARSLWKSRHFTHAVSQALASLNTHTQARVDRREPTEAALFQEVFSTSDPAPGRPRLRLTTPEETNQKTFKAMQQGAIALADALYGGVRNPLSHGKSSEFDEQVALELLCTISILARWVEHSKVVHAERSPAPDQ